MAEERLALSLVEKISKLSQLKNDPRQYGAAGKLIKELVNGFNNYELMKLDSLDEQDYSAHLMLHLIDGSDIVNAKFLYERIPEPIKKQSQSFIKLWSAVKALSQNRFGTALQILRDSIPTKQSQNPIAKQLEPLREILVWHLSEHTVPEFIASAYSNIEMARVKELLGQPSNLDQLLQKSSLLASANADAQGFVEVSQRPAQSETFALDQTRVQKLCQVVQFLERQQYDVTETATQAIAAENSFSAAKAGSK